MARLTQAGVELKCRRCKRMVVVPLGGETADWIEVSMR
jgi:ribosomal protein S27E